MDADDLNEKLIREIVSVALRVHDMADDEWAHRIVIDEVDKRKPQTTMQAVEAMKDGLRQYPLCKPCQMG